MVLVDNFHIGKGTAVKSCPLFCLYGRYSLQRVNYTALRYIRLIWPQNGHIWAYFYIKKYLHNHIKEATSEMQPQKCGSCLCAPSGIAHYFFMQYSLSSASSTRSSSSSAILLSLLEYLSDHLIRPRKVSSRFTTLHFLADMGKSNIQ